MPSPSTVTDHYGHGSLIESIRAGISQLGKTPDELTIDDLGPLDEFHIGGRAATEHFLSQLEIQPTHRVLDLGCGLGGASRFTAQRYSCQVSGIDLTPEYIATGKVLCDWVGLSSQVQLQVGDVAALPHADAAFDRAYMMHVGMNIRDKSSVATEVFRVLRPDGLIGIYDIMTIEDGPIDYPVPWASSADGSALASPAEYKNALAAAGFEVISEHNRRDFALAFFEQLQAKANAGNGPPPLGLHLVMGKNAPIKIKNMIGSIAQGKISPVELIAIKPGA